MIKSLLSMLTEAGNEMALPKEDVSAAPIAGGDTMGATDFAPAPPPMAAMGMPQGAPAMPQAQQGPNTIQKDVLNKQLVLAITSELKGVISTYEKRFENTEFSVEDAKIYLNSFLQSLAYHADNIANLIGEEIPEEGAGMEMPPEDIMPPEPAVEEPIAPPVETGMLPEVSPELSEPATVEPNMFTEPNAATGGF